jgi:hypothetical protein
VSSLATETFRGVELLEAGVRIHGRGSPAAGDVYTVADLERMASASRELAGELHAPAKIGHGGDQPAVGWLENLRVNGTKLVADVTSVPRRFVELIENRAYRTRSVELSRVTSQRTGRTYDRVVTGLAWLGGKMPAVRTLDDVVKLYESDSTVTRLLELPEPGSSGSVDASINAAIADGRISRDEEDSWRRLFEIDVATTARLLEARAPMVVHREFASSEDAYRAHAAATLGIREDEVL